MEQNVRQNTREQEKMKVENRYKKTVKQFLVAIKRVESQGRI